MTDAISSFFRYVFVSVSVAFESTVAFVSRYFAVEVRTIRIVRIGIRVVIVGVIMGSCMWFTKETHPTSLFFSVWLGTTVGFGTNVIVTWFLLVVFVPRMKSRIAHQMSDFALRAAHLDELPQKIANRTALGAPVVGLLIGMFIPLSVPILLGSLASGMVGGGLVVGAKRLTEGKLRKISEDLVESIVSMSNRDISSTMDKIIGPLLIVMEVLGGVLGAIAGGAIHIVMG